MAALVCKVLGIVFILIALWGFIDGHEVLIFHVNTAHNVVHLLSGVVALLCGLKGEKPSKLFCLIFGAVYGLVAILGFMGVAAVVELLHLNEADNYLHAALAALFLIAGFTSKAKIA